MVLMRWLSMNLFHSKYPSFTENRQHCTASTLYTHISLVLGLWRPRYATIDSSILRFLWNTPNSWQLVFSFSSNGNIFAILEKAKFWLSCACSKTVWRPRDRWLDDRYTAASVKPSPSTLNTPPTYTQAVVYTLNIKHVQVKHYFRKKCKFEGLLFVWFRWNVQVVLFLPITVALCDYVDYPGKQFHCISVMK